MTQARRCALPVLVVARHTSAHTTHTDEDTDHWAHTALTERCSATVRSGDRTTTDWKFGLPFLIWSQPLGNQSKMGDLPDDMGQPSTNVLSSLLVPPSRTSFVTVCDATIMSCSEDEINKTKRLSEKRARKERHRSNPKLNITASPQPPSLNDVLSLPHLSNVSPIQPSPAVPDTTSPSTKNVARLEYNNNNRDPLVIHCQMIKGSPFLRGSRLHCGFGGLRSDIKNLVL
ncbi:hypothetical protein EVAR_50372_1 [Eumeta japonica]|uniref:Uncharacterized protein n=1 Tax=Eumeta variegata TaxID=151549 RepID=A0A4C1Y105_EUMVA|nr:hypothetical protein EVAR_50372_1 [Eumeta japonica]